MLAPCKKSYDKPREHIKKQRHYFAKIHLAKAMVFLVVMYGCESPTVKKAERRRIYAFELWCWRRLLRVPWTARRSNQSILKEISPEYSSEGLMLKLKLQRTDSFEKTLMLGKIEGGRRRGWQRMKCLDASPTQWTWVWSSTGSWWWTGKPGMLQSMGSQRVRHDCVTELNWGTSWGPTTSMPLHTWYSMLCFLPVIFPLESDKNWLFCTIDRKHIISYFSGFLIRFKIFKCRGKALEWSSF